MPIDIKSTVKCLSLINDDMQIREGFHIFTLEKEMAPTPVFLPEELCGQRSLAGYSLWSRKESDMTEHKKNI